MFLVQPTYMYIRPQLLLTMMLLMSHEMSFAMNKRGIPCQSEIEVKTQKMKTDVCYDRLCFEGFSLVIRIHIIGLIGAMTKNGTGSSKF